MEKKDISSMTAGDDSDFIAADTPQDSQLTPGPYQVWLIYAKDSGEGLAYTEGFGDPAPTRAEVRHLLGMARVPEELWPLFFEFGPCAFYYIEGQIRFEVDMAFDTRLKKWLRRS